MDSLLDWAKQVGRKEISFKKAEPHVLPVQPYARGPSLTSVG
jgi:hypothetical protein